MTEHDLTESVSPAGFIELMLSNALANGQSAVSARLIDFRESAKSTTFELGSDVKVAIAYRQGPHDTEHTDVVRLDRAWELVNSGGELVRLACPDEQPPKMFIAAAMVMDSNHVRHDLVVIDRTGGAWSLADPTEVDGRPVGDTLRQHVLRYADPTERKRAQGSASKTREYYAGTAASLNLVRR